LFYAFFRLAPWQRGGGGYRNRSKKWYNIVMSR
jgi:hypothetical protein